MGRLSDLLKRKTPETSGKADGSVLASAFPDLADLDLQYDGTGNILEGRKRFAVGLDWETVQADAPVRDQAARGHRGGYRRGLHVRLGAQYGFASADRQHKRGSQALITTARSELLGERWAGAFRINEADRFWWVAAVRDGEIYEDVVLADEVSARTLLLDVLDAPDWTRIIAPADWKISGTEPARIEQAFSMRSGSTLRPVDGRGDLIQRVVILSLIGALGGGGYYYWTELKRQEAERAAELTRMRDEMVRVDPATYPWASATPLEDFVETCVREIEGALALPPGWRPGPITCTASGRAGAVTAEWGRDGGRFPWLLAATRAKGAPATLLEGGERAQSRRGVSFPERPDTGVDVPWTAADISDLLSSRLQTLGLTATLRPRVRSLTAEQRQELRAPVYNRHDLLIETSVGIEEYARLLSDVPALTPEALVYGVGTGTWSLTAKIYHPPILPLPPS
jgi:hypothetical protein